MNKILVVLYVFLLLFQFADSAYANSGNKQTIGWVESVVIDNDSFQVQAKIDTGADSSSINVVKSKTFNKNGKKMIRFTIFNKTGSSHTIEKEVIKYIKIKRKLLPSQKRPVVRMKICLAGIKKEVLVNLTDRSNYKYQVLIGRRFLKESFLVDSEYKNMTSPGC